MRLVRVFLRGFLVPVLITVALLCTAGFSPTWAQKAGARAGLSLVSSNAAITQSSNTEWTLTKTGSIDASNSAVSWQVSATPKTTVAGWLMINGVITVANSGAGGGTLGNVVVNLQIKSGNKWVTRSSVIADATHDDAATVALISPSASSENLGSFSENAASGMLRFTDATNNSAFALSPQVTIPPGATVTLLFSASFNNNILALPLGTATRSEIIVSFGNAVPSTASAPNVDVNGNGKIDADEDWVRSIPARITLDVPAEQSSNGEVLLSDSVQDITTTGTVTFSNPQITLDQNTHSGAVLLNYNSGANGGTITNCAHLTGAGQTQTVTGGFVAASFPNIPALNLTACNTQMIPPRTCTPGTAGCGWKDGDMTTHSQVYWGNDQPSTASDLLTKYFATVYFSTGGLLVGLVPTYNMTFDSDQAIFDYLLETGAPAPLNANLSNPTSAAAGAFGGEVVGLKLNVDFSDNNLLSSSANLHFGDLRICAVNPTIDGVNVRTLLTYANSALGGGSAPLTVTELNTLTANLNASFGEGGVSVFAHQHLFNGACPVASAN